MQLNKMDEYITNYETYDKTIVYSFTLGEGGIGDYIKFFSYLLCFCIKHKFKLKHFVTDAYILNYIKLKKNGMYVTVADIDKQKISKFSTPVSVEQLINIDSTKIYFICPFNLYNICSLSDITIKLDDIFYFSTEIVDNSYKLTNCQDYISVHVRLGDEFLETDKKFIQSGGDKRNYNLENICRCIENNSDKKILLFCDNMSFKVMLKEKYQFIKVTNGEIGHTSLFNTTKKQMLDAITEFYLLTKSQKIYAGSHSGFSQLAAKFNHSQIESI
jgi:hypothetical protein